MNKRRRSGRRYAVPSNGRRAPWIILSLCLVAALIAVVFWLGRGQWPLGGAQTPTQTPTTNAPAETPAETPVETSVPTPAPTPAPTPEKTEAPEQTAAPTEQPAPAPANPLDTGAPRGTGAPAPASTAALAAFSATSARSVEAGDAATPEGTAQPDAALPLSGVLVGIDPGHQAHANREQELVSPGGKTTKDKVSSGTAGVKTRVAEYKVNLDVSLALRDALQAQGATVYMTRETHDVDISNIERAQMMNEHGVDIVLRIHCNGSENRSAQGIGLYIRKTGEGADECYRAAEALLPAMVEATGAKATGIHKSDSYSGLNWSTVPSILVEMGYMSNAEEDVKLNDPDYQGKLVAGMVEGVARYMGKSDESAES